MNNENILDKSAYNFSKLSEWMQIIIIGACALILPTFAAQWVKGIFGATSFIAQNSQIIIGSLVNTALITAAINLKGWKKIISIVTLPSISTILGGYVFGTSSAYMVYMIPAIWIGNFLLVYTYKFVMLAKNKNYFLAGIAGIILKVAVIFLAFQILNAIGVFPEKVGKLFATAMGTTQLITASIGVIVSSIIYKIEKHIN